MKVERILLGRKTEKHKPTTKDILREERRQGWVDNEKASHEKCKLAGR